MNSGFGRYLLSILTMMGFTGLVLVGCDNSLLLDDALSPRADIRIISLGLPGQSQVLSPFVGALQGTESTENSTPVTQIGYPDVSAVLRIFNGVSAEVHSVSIEYLESDGVSPVLVAPGFRLAGFSAPLNLFMFGGQPSQANFDSIDPTATTGVVGQLGGGVLRFPVVTTGLIQFASGGDGTFNDGNEIARVLLARFTIFGEDVNRHSFTLSQQVAINTAIPLTTIQ